MNTRVLEREMKESLTKFSSIFCFVLMMLMSPPSLIAKGDPEAGKAKSAVCAACHGQDGNSINPDWPSLAGQHEKYLIQSMKAYKNQMRKNAIMYPLAMSLSDQDIEDLAAYYHSQKAAQLTYDEELAKEGESIYRGGTSNGVAACIACHGPNGKGNPGAGYPVLAGQHASYTVIALKEYSNGNREAGINNMMQSIAPRMTEREMNAVAEYIQALGR